jgi:LysM repeat protein
MQRIEKYGVIALVFLLVTILAVSLWSQKKGKSPFSFFKRNQDAQTAQADPTPPAAPPMPNEPLPGAPLNPNGTAQPNYVAQNPASAQPSLGAQNPAAHPAQLAPQPANDLPTGQPAAPQSFASNPDADPTPNEPKFKSFDSPKNSAANGPTRTYVVKQGDTLGEIASRELGSFGKWTEIQKLNANLDPAKVRPGMKLTLPGAAKIAANDAKPKPVSASATPVASSSGYTVKKGDTLSSIAAKALGNSSRWVEIKRLNPEIRADRLVAGMHLRLPQGTRAANVDGESVAKLSPKNRVR